MDFFQGARGTRIMKSAKGTDRAQSAVRVGVFGGGLDEDVEIYLLILGIAAVLQRLAQFANRLGAPRAIGVRQLVVVVANDEERIRFAIARHVRDIAFIAEHFVPE